MPGSFWRLKNGNYVTVIFTAARIDSWPRIRGSLAIPCHLGGKERGMKYVHLGIKTDGRLNMDLHAAHRQLDIFFGESTPTLYEHREYKVGHSVWIKIGRGEGMSRRRGTGSIVHDVKVCLNEIDMIGKSKRETREEGVQGIHSLKQKEHTLSACQNFVKWTREEFGVKKVYELTEGHYSAYLGHLESGGRSLGHRRNVETAIKHLQIGLNARSTRFGKENVTFIPEKRVTPFEVSEGVSNRSYTNSEVKALLEHVPASTRDAVTLMRGLGLRVRESANIRVEHFVRTEGGWRVQIDKGAGITKGGRFRHFDVPKSFERELERLLQGKGPMERLVRIKVDTIRESVSKGLKKAGIEQNRRGCHGFRHAFARSRVETIFEERGLNERGHQMMQRILGNREVGRQADYGILKIEDQQLYLEVREVMDKVHGEIGHGANRWDLAMRYMRL